MNFSGISLSLPTPPSFGSMRLAGQAAPTKPLPHMPTAAAQAHLPTTKPGGPTSPSALTGTVGNTGSAGSTNSIDQPSTTDGDTEARNEALERFDAFVEFVHEGLQDMLDFRTDLTEEQRAAIGDVLARFDERVESLRAGFVERTDAEPSDLNSRLMDAFGSFNHGVHDIIFGGGSEVPPEPDTPAGPLHTQGLGTHDRGTGGHGNPIQGPLIDLGGVLISIDVTG